MRNHETTKELIASNLERLQSGETTLAALKGIQDEALDAGVRAAKRLTRHGEFQAAEEVLAGLALYDPYRPDLWSALEELYIQMRSPEKARVFSGLARAMAA